jgi:hypothetical protein
MMKLASRVITVAATAALFCLTGFAQNDGSRMLEKDPRNTAPTCWNWWTGRRPDRPFYRIRRKDPAERRAYFKYCL